MAATQFPFRNVMYLTDAKQVWSECFDFNVETFWNNENVGATTWTMCESFVVRHADDVQAAGHTLHEVIEAMWVVTSDYVTFSLHGRSSDLD